VERLTGDNRLVLGGLLWWADLPIEAPVSGDLYHAGFSQASVPLPLSSAILSKHR